MKKILLLVFAILVLSFSIHDVAATVYVLDQTTCTAIGGTWNSATCTISSFITSPSGVTVQIPSGITVRFTGTITINSADILYNAGIINNLGTVNNGGQIYNAIPMPFPYTFDNKNYVWPEFKPGVINNMGTINNGGKIYNYGTSINNSGGLIANSGTIENLGITTFATVGNKPPTNWIERATINNTKAGTILNNIGGNIKNMDGGVINNTYGSTINNFAMIDNSGQSNAGSYEYSDAKCGQYCIGVILPAVPSIITNSGIFTQFCTATIIGSPVDNAGTGTTRYIPCATPIPEFGQMAEIILALSIISVMMILRKSKFTHL